MRRILAVCKGNRARSPMFEALLRQWIEQKSTNSGLEVESAAGLQEAHGKEAEEGAVIALKGIGIDISEHRARFIGFMDPSQFDVIYCMDPGVVPIVEEHLKIHLPSRTRVVLINAPDGIPNPYGKDQAAYDLALVSVQQGVNWALSEDLFPML